MRGAYLFLGALLVGIGLGQILGETGAWTLIGLGVGFLLWGLVGARVWVPGMKDERADTLRER